MKSFVLNLKESFKKEFLTTFIFCTSFIFLIVLFFLAVTGKIDKFSGISLLIIIVLYNILAQIKSLKDDIRKLNK